MQDENSPLVTLVEPDTAARERLHRALSHASFDVIDAAGGIEALARIFKARPSACLIAGDAPGFGGEDLVMLLSAVTDIPIIATLREPDAARSAALRNAGADDVIPKETGAFELGLRLRAVLRGRDRRGGSGDERFVLTGELVIDRTARSVTKGGRPVAVTSTEFRLLDALASRMGEAVPHAELLRAVWGQDHIYDTHYLRLYVSYLRRKLEDHRSNPTYILSEWGRGYLLAARPPAGARPVRGSRRGARQQAGGVERNARHRSPA